MYSPWGFKTVNHETGHTMGQRYLIFIHIPAVMGLIFGQSPDYLRYFAVLKWQLGWITYSQVDCRNQSGTTTHQISLVEVHAGLKELV
jgi:hypothetical protein